MGFLRGLFGNSPLAENAAIGPRGNCQRSHRPIRLQFRRQTRCQGIGCEPRFGALLATVKKHDAGHADSLTAEDIAARVDAWKQSGGVLFSGRTKVTLDGKPLEGALVTWEPEPYLGPAYHPLSGTTNKNGYAYLSPALEDFQGIYVGLYTVRISKKVQGKETIPACYNEKSTLGREVAVDVPDAEHLFDFNLKSK